MDEIEQAARSLKHGAVYPYAQGYEIRDAADAAAMGIAVDLCDRRGIKWEMGKVDDEVRHEIIHAHAAIIREAMKNGS